MSFELLHFFSFFFPFSTNYSYSFFSHLPFSFFFSFLFSPPISSFLSAFQYYLKISSIIKFYLITLYKEIYIPRTQMHINSQIHRPIHTNTWKQKHIHRHTHTNTYTQTHKHKHIHTNLYTQTDIQIQFIQTNIQRHIHISS